MLGASLPLLLSTMPCLQLVRQLPPHSVPALDPWVLTLYAAWTVASPAFEGVGSVGLPHTKAT